MRDQLLLTFCFLILHVSCKKFTIPVILNIHSSTDLFVDNCLQLTMRAKIFWDQGGFTDCVPESRINQKLNRFSITYKITVNTDKIRGFRKSLGFIETLAAVNGYLNYNVRMCATHTGPNWDLNMDDDEPFKALAEVTIPRNQSVVTFCQNLYKQGSYSTDSHLLRGCNIGSAVFTKTSVRQLFRLQFRRNRILLRPSSNLFRVMREFSNAINQVIPGCVQVTRVVKTADCNVAFVYLQFMKQIGDDGYDEKWKNTNGCHELLRGYATGGYDNCSVIDQPRRKNDLVTYTVVIQKVDSKSKKCYDTWSKNEVSLRTEALFNSRVQNCISYRINHQQKIHDENYTANIYGPWNTSLCNMFQLRNESMYRRMFSSCAIHRWKNATFFERLPALYRLRLKQPIFVYDLPLYNKWLSLILMMLNLPHSVCKYNGYVGRINYDI